MNNKKVLIIGIISAIVILGAIISSIIFMKYRNKTLETFEINDLEANLEEIIEEDKEDVLDLTATEEEDEEELKNETEKQENNKNKKSNETNNNTISSKTNYYIKVNYQANVVTVYQKDGNGNFQPLRALTCSTGSATPRSGVYNTKAKWTWGLLFGNVWGHYVTKIVGNILFHSVPYTAQNPASLEYWEYDKLGTTASAGCVRLCVRDSKWIFDNMPTGTPVEFYASSDPGPLGKPGTQKISSNVECRGWDPTDPDSRNPWRNYTAQTTQTEIKNEENKQEETKKEDKAETNNTTNLNQVENNVENTTQNQTESENTIKEQPKNEINTSNNTSKNELDTSNTTNITNETKIITNIINGTNTSLSTNVVENIIKNNE